MKPLMYLVTLLICLPAMAAPVKIEIEHHKPANLFEVGQPVTFTATVKGLPQSNGEATAVITDFYGQAKSFNIPLQAKGGEPTSFTIDLGTPEPGYYDLKV